MSPGIPDWAVRRASTTIQKNGVENYFGTHPGIFNAGLNVVQLSGSTFTYSHPLSDSPADDISASYKWSTDLITFHNNEDTVNGTSVTFTQGTPSDGMVDVTPTFPARHPIRYSSDWKSRTYR